MSVVVRNIRRAASEVVDAFSHLSVATVHEAQHRTGLLSAGIAPIFPGPVIAGSAVTCEVAPGDNWMIHVAAELCQAGDVLVVTPTSPCRDGYFGDLLGCFLQTRGVRGLVIDAGVRDIAVLREMGFPVWSSAVFAQGTVKETMANVNVPIVCAGVSVRPGDVVVADEDGVVVVPRAEAAEVLAAALRREEKEAVARQRLLAGELSLDVFGLRGRLETRELTYIEGPVD